MIKRFDDLVSCCICSIQEPFMGAYRTLWEVLDPMGESWDPRVHADGKGDPHYICDRCTLIRTMENVPELK